MRHHIFLYHYTCHSHKENIIATEEIWTSLKKHQHFGPGAYGTKLDPSFGKEAIARNNWLTHWKDKLVNGCVDYAIWVKIPKRRIEYCDTDDPDRSIVKHKVPIRLQGRRGVNWGVIKVVDP